MYQLEQQGVTTTITVTYRMNQLLRLLRIAEINHREELNQSESFYTGDERDNYIEELLSQHRTRYQRHMAERIIYWLYKYSQELTYKEMDVLEDKARAFVTLYGGFPARGENRIGDYELLTNTIKEDIEHHHRNLDTSYGIQRETDFYEHLRKSNTLDAAKVLQLGYNRNLWETIYQRGGHRRYLLNINDEEEFIQDNEGSETDNGYNDEENDFERV